MNSCGYTMALARCTDIYEQFFRDTSQLKSLEHVPNEIIKGIDPNGFIVVQENQMGISFSAVAELYSKCSQILNVVDSSVLEKEEERAAEIASKIFLCVNGENSKCIHIRMTLLKSDHLQLEEELHFNEVLCLKFKKSSFLWEYRYQLLLIFLKSGKSPLELLEKQQNFLSQMIAKHPRNYHAWTFKIKLLKYIFGKDKVDSTIVTSEVQWTKQFISRNCHEYSAYSYLYFLIKQSGFTESISIVKWANDLRLSYTKMDFDHHPLSEINYSKLTSLSTFIAKLSKQTAK